jgi:hypothetical protein
MAKVLGRLQIRATLDWDDPEETAIDSVTYTIRDVDDPGLSHTRQVPLPPGGLDYSTPLATLLREMAAQIEQAEGVSTANAKAITDAYLAR